MSNSDDILPAIKEVGNRLRRKAMKALSPAEPAPKLPRHSLGPITTRTQREIERALLQSTPGSLYFNALSELIDRHDYYALHAGDPCIKLRDGENDGA